MISDSNSGWGFAEMYWTRSTVGVLAEQGALGTTQDLDPLHVQRTEDTGTAGNVVVVQIESGSCRPRAAAASAPSYAANEKYGRTTAIGLAKLDIGHEVADVLDVVDAHGLHRIRADGSDGQRDVLKILVAPAGRYHDLFQDGCGRC